jgi:phosphate uptake regulator
MRRKLILQGKKSFTVTLPIRWLERYKVKDEVEVNEKESFLEIRPAGVFEEKPRVKEMDIRDLPAFLFARLLGAYYKSGYDEIRLKCNTEQLDTIKQIVTELIGYEIIEAKPESLVIKRVVKSSAEQYYDSEKKCWHVLQGMAEDCLAGLKGDKKALRAVIDADPIIDKFSDYCMHILLKYKETEASNPFTPYLFVYQLEKVADLVAKTAEIATHSKSKPDSWVLNLYEDLREHIKEFYLAYYRFDFEIMKRLVIRYENFTNQFNKLVQKVSGEDRVYLINLKEAFDALSWLITPLLIKQV